MAVKIVTDSTADLPYKFLSEHGIGVVPLNVHFGEEVLKDGVDIWSEEFYHRLKNGPILPNTSQPAPGEFLNVYRKTAVPGDVIISLHISEAMSGTLGSARIAAEMLGPEYDVRIINSQTVCMPLGLFALKAARLANAGADADTIIHQIKKWQNDIEIYFTVNSLEYLQRTGRIGKASALLGTLLNIKPLLSIVDGVIVPVEKVRGNFLKVAQLMVENLEAKFGKRRVTLSIVHTEIPEAVQALRDLALDRLHVGEYYSSLIGPVVGSHAGPNTIGIIALPEE